MEENVTYEAEFLNQPQNNLLIKTLRYKKKQLTKN